LSVRVLPCGVDTRGAASFARGDAAVDPGTLAGRPGARKAYLAAARGAALARLRQILPRAGCGGTARQRRVVPARAGGRGGGEQRESKEGTSCGLHGDSLVERSDPARAAVAGRLTERRRACAYSRAAPTRRARVQPSKPLPDNVDSERRLFTNRTWLFRLTCDVRRPLGRERRGTSGAERAARNERRGTSGAERAARNERRGTSGAERAARNERRGTSGAERAARNERRGTSGAERAARNERRGTSGAERAARNERRGTSGAETSGAGTSGAERAARNERRGTSGGRQSQ